MKSRKTHTKSRKGCIPCKKRHVKCDEQGPICANCRVRKTKCEYPGSPPRPSPSVLSTGEERTGSASSASNGMLSFNSDRRRGSRGRSTSSLSPCQSPAMLSPPMTCNGDSLSRSHQSTPEHVSALATRKMIELQLMHRWSTTTYLSTCSLPEDHHLMQTIVPREGLKHDFLLHAVFAVTALDLAINVAVDQQESNLYLQAAMEYYDSASSAMRQKIVDQAPDEYWMIFLTSSLFVFHHCAMPLAAHGNHNGDHTALSHVTTLFALLTGSSSLGMPHAMAMFESPISSIKTLGLPDHDLLPHELRSVLDRLRAINSHVNDGSHPDEVRPLRPMGPLVDPEPVTDHEAHRRAIHHLASCFTEDARGIVQGYCASFPGWNGSYFGKLVSRHDPMALLILMHWGVLLHRLGKSVWWASTIGSSLVAELSETLRHSQMYMLQEVRDSIQWTERQVGMTDMSAAPAVTLSHDTSMLTDPSLMAASSLF